MAECEEPQDGTEGTEPQDGEAGPGAPLDEEAAWAQIVASFGTLTRPGEGDWPDAENLPEDGSAPGPPAAATGVPPAGDGIPVIPRAYVIKLPAPGPRDFAAADDEDEGHFVPPEPPPLPEADVTTKFAWLAVLGGPLLMVVYVLLGEQMPWWAVVVGVGGFLGGFGTLIGRMKDPDDEDDDPDGGAVV